MAYLASTLFLDHKDDTIILVVNTLQSDLKSDNYLVGEPDVPFGGPRGARGSARPARNRPSARQGWRDHGASNRSAFCWASVRT